MANALMAKALQSARPAKPLHLYRHLLRESSYLPPYARPFFDGRIKTRFRNHAHSADIKTPIKQGQHGLRYLRAALVGDRARMLRLMHMAFGRVGERRRMLLNHLVMPDAPSGTLSLEEYIKEAQAKTDRDPDWLDKWNLDRLMVFARSQARQTFNMSPRPELQNKQLNMEQWTTGTTIWGNTLSPKLARSRLRKAWADVATRILPPIPKSEWELLRDLSRGSAPASVWEPPPRRPLAPRLALDEVGSEKEEWNWERCTALPIEQVEKTKNRWSKMLSGNVGTGTPADPSPLGRHKATPKMWRRMLSSIWALTAYMEKSATGKGWDIVWGSDHFEPLTATGAHAEFFKDTSETPMKQKTKQRKR